jgi:hypothetical protein
LSGDKLEVVAKFDRHSHDVLASFNRGDWKYECFTNAVRLENLIAAKIVNCNVSELLLRKPRKKVLEQSKRFHLVPVGLALQVNAVEERRHPFVSFGP